MQYFGGKSKTAAEICGVINGVVAGRRYVEPFVGGANIVSRVTGASERVACDASAALITMWSSVCAGWEPPDRVSEEDYVALQESQDPTNPLTAFVGFGCSFAGKWFGGYARDSARNYAANAKNSVLKKAAGLSDVTWCVRDYRDVDYRPGDVVYMDPPYAGTTQYGAVGTFDSAEFWRFAQDLSLECVVLVSEYAAPDGWASVWQKKLTTDIRGKGGRLPRVEKLFYYDPLSAA